MVRLTDSEVAVMRDSVSKVRADLQAHEFSTPNLDTALEKLDSLLRPDTYGLLLVPITAEERFTVFSTTP